MGSCTVSSPNYFGDKRKCVPILNNEVKFIFTTDPGYTLYLLEFIEDRENIRILIKDGDSIHVSCDFNNMIKSLKASGKGSSMTNYLLADNIIWPKTIPDLSTEEILPYWEKIQIKELSLIECFKNKTLINFDGITTDESATLNSLIKNSNLTPNECKLLENRTYYYIATAIGRTPYDYVLKNTESYLSLFANIDFEKNFILNDYATDDLTGCYVSLNCNKDFFDKKGSNNPDSLRKFRSKYFFNTTLKVLKGKPLQKFLCDNIYNSMLDGNYTKYDNIFTVNKNIITDKNYLKKIEDFHSNFLSALINPTLNLDSPDKVLNDSNVLTLLDSFRGHKVYLTIWKVGSGMSYPLSPLYKMQTIKYIHQEYEPKGIKFLNICLDDGTLKQHWASSIINNDWHGDHYYYVGSDSSKFRQMFGLIGSLRSCNGEMYYIVDESGKITVNNDSELILTIK